MSVTGTPRKRATDLVTKQIEPLPDYVNRVTVVFGNEVRPALLAFDVATHGCNTTRAWKASCIVNLSATNPRSSRSRFSTPSRHYSPSNTPHLALNRTYAHSEIRLVELWPSQLPNFESLARHLAKETPRDVTNLGDWRPLDGNLGQSLATWLPTNIALDEFPSVTKNIGSIRKEIRSYLLSYWAISRLCKNLASATEVFVFNGRRPSWQGAIDAALALDLKVKFYEGEGRGFYFLDGRRPHDHNAVTEASQTLASRLTMQEINEVSHTFLHKRRSDASLNPFLMLQGAPIEPNNEGRRRFSLRSEKKIAVLFTSSPDEFAAMPGRGPLGWSHQYEALVQVCERLNQVGYDCVIRVHPNLSQKSWREIRRTHRMLGGVSARVFGPLDNINSYDLIELAHIIVVWHSTVGLEASARGKAVWLLGHPDYSAFADVKTVRNVQELEQETFEVWPVNAEAALPALAYSYFGGVHRSRVHTPGLISQLEVNSIASRRTRFSRLNAYWDGFRSLKTGPGWLVSQLRSAGVPGPMIARLLGLDFSHMNH